MMWYAEEKLDTPKSQGWQTVDKHILNTVNMQFIIANQPHILDTPTLFCGEIPMFDVYIPICTKYTVFKK